MSTTIDRERLTPRSALRYRPVAPIMETQDVAYSKPRASRARSQQELHAVGGHTTPTTKKHSIHWLVPVAMTMLATIVLLWLLQLVWSWAATLSDDLRYGRPRTTQIDAYLSRLHARRPVNHVHDEAASRMGTPSVSPSRQDQASCRFFASQP